MKDKNGVLLDYDQTVEYKKLTGKVIEFLEEYVTIKTSNGYFDCKPEELKIL